MENISVEMFNENLVTEVEPTFNISFEDIQNAYKKVFYGSNISEINIVFVDSQYIKDLNSRYRSIEAPTDVLSFNLENRKGEIYICPEYIYQSFQEDSFEEEILRVIIHGTLHILGYDHSESMNDSPNEKMFKIQEELLLKFKNICC